MKPVKRTVYKKAAYFLLAASVLCAFISSMHAEENSLVTLDSAATPESPPEHRPIKLEDPLPFVPPPPDGEIGTVNPGPGITGTEPLSREERMAHARVAHAGFRRPEIADPQSARNREIRTELMQLRGNRLAREEEREAAIRKGYLERRQDPRMVPLTNEAAPLPREVAPSTEEEDQGTIHDDE